MKRGVDAAKVRLWTRRFQKLSNSGLSVGEFCRREAVSFASFYRWKKKLAGNSLVDAATRSGERRRGRDSERNGEPQSFQRLHIIADGSPRADAQGVTVRMSGGIEIDLGNDPAVICQVVGQLLDRHAVEGD